MAELAGLLPHDAALSDAPQPLALERDHPKAYNAFGYSGSGLCNSNGTLAWQPKEFIMCYSEADVVAAVKAASANGSRVITVGSGWSWSTTIASNDDNVRYIKLDGDLRSLSVDTDKQLAYCGGAACAHELYPALQAANLEVEAHGICYTASVSQTVAGLLATNVHAEGLKTFYDVCASVDVVLADGNVQTAPAGSELFNLTIGGAGETGVLIRATLHLAPRSSYQQHPSTMYVHPLALCNLGGFSLARAAALYLDEFGDAPAFNEKVALANSVRGLVHSTERYEKLPAPDPAMHDLTPGWGEIEKPRFWLARAFGNCCNWNPFCFTPCYGLATATCISVLDPTPGLLMYTFPQCGCQPLPCQERTAPKSLDLASLFPHILYLHHNEAELYVPTDLAVAVGTLLDERMPHICGRYLLALRFVFGCDSLTAANANQGGGQRTDFVCLNFDEYRQSTWPTFNADMDDLAAMLHAEFPNRIFYHPGKYNCGGHLPRHADAPAVRDKMRALDPKGMFARPAFDASVLSRGLSAPPCCFALPQRCFTTCF